MREAPSPCSLTHPIFAASTFLLSAEHFKLFKMYSEDALSAFLYFITIAMSLGDGGASIEGCDLRSDLVKCSDRAKAFSAFSILTGLVAAPLLAANLANISVIQRFEVMIAPVAVLFAIIACAIGTSPRTSQVVFPFLMWYSFIAVSAAMFLALKKKTGDPSPKEKHVDHHLASVPVAGSTTSSVPMPPMQPSHPSYAAPTQPMAPAAAGTAYSPPV